MPRHEHHLVAANGAGTASIPSPSPRVIRSPLLEKIRVLLGQRRRRRVHQLARVLDGREHLLEELHHRVDACACRVPPASIRASYDPRPSPTASSRRPRRRRWYARLRAARASGDALCLHASGFRREIVRQISGPSLDAGETRRPGDLRDDGSNASPSVEAKTTLGGRRERGARETEVRPIFAGTRGNGGGIG